MGTSECECNGPGYCPRHRIDKTAGLHEQCLRNVRYRALWDRRVGMSNEQMACDRSEEHTSELQSH